jgi:hypothetical protein
MTDLEGGFDFLPGRRSHCSIDMSALQGLYSKKGSLLSLHKAKDTTEEDGSNFQYVIIWFDSQYG